MSKPQWDALVEQLQDPDPKIRRKACQRLAVVGDPAVIPFLRAAYYQEDDESVRQAARDGLARFKAIQAGEAPRGLPVSDQTLTRLLAGLAGLFVILLLANVGVRILGGDQDQPDGPSGPMARDALIAQIQDRKAQTEPDIIALLTVIDGYFANGNFACDTRFNRPKPVAISAINRQYYPDLGPIGDKLDTAISNLALAQEIWDQACKMKLGDQLTEARRRAVEAQNLLPQVDSALEFAIRFPAPTYGPSPTFTPTITLTPTVTLTPTLTLTPGPGTPTAAATATGLPSTTLLPTVTLAAEPTQTPTPTPLPLPALDYPQIASDMEERFVVISDLTNRLGGTGTGIINLWEQAQAGQPVPVGFCTFDEWPGPFELTPEQTAELEKPGVADPVLDEAINLLNEGLALANQARALFEPSCQQQTLSSTADDGLPLAQEALEKLREAQQLVEIIDRRK